MKRIQKERDRLLRKLARIYGLTGAVGALLCVIVPGTATGIQFAAAALLSVAAGALVVPAHRAWRRCRPRSASSASRRR